MFALIETKNATHIAIHIPLDGADKTLPALAAMLEKNAVFISKTWSSIDIVSPEMSIVLGDKFKTQNDNGELVIAEAGTVIGEGFVPAAPDVFISNVKAMKAKDEVIKKQKTEIEYFKATIKGLEQKIEEFNSVELD